MIRQKVIFCVDQCSGMRAWYDGDRPGMSDFFYISWYEDRFYSEQARGFKRLERRWKYLTGDPVVGELYTDSKKLKELLAWLKRLPELSTEKSILYSKLEFQLEPLNDKPMKYRMLLKGTLSKKAVFTGHYFSMFDLELNEIEKQSMISQLEAVLKV